MVGLENQGSASANLSTQNTSANTPLTQIGSTSLGQTTPVIQTTFQDVILLHEITDEQLDILSQGSSGNLGNFFWATVGLLGGSASAAYKVAGSTVFASPPEKMQSNQLFDICLFVGSVVAALVSGAIIFSHPNEAAKLVKKIRARKNRR